MKRIIVLLLATACLTAAYLSGHSQQPAEPEMITFTKVGVVNMGQIYTKYGRVKHFRDQMEREALPYKMKKDTLEKSIMEWREIATSTDEGVSKETRQMAMAVIVESNRQLEDLNIQVKQDLAKKLEEEMIELDRIIQQKIQKHGTALGYHLVLAYGEPEVPLQGLQQIRRRMTVIDQGGMSVAYASAGTDISREVLEVLNREYRDANEGDGDE